MSNSNNNEKEQFEHQPEGTFSIEHAIEYAENFLVSQPVLNQPVTPSDRQIRERLEIEYNRIREEIELNQRIQRLQENILRGEQFLAQFDEPYDIATINLQWNRRAATIAATTVEPKNVLRPLETHSNGCTICLDSQAMSLCETSECHHEFHLKCISEWLASNKSCPVCRKPLKETILID